MGTWRRSRSHGGRTALPSNHDCDRLMPNQFNRTMQTVPWPSNTSRLSCSKRGARSTRWARRRKGAWVRLAALGDAKSFVGDAKSSLGDSTLGCLVGSSYVWCPGTYTSVGRTSSSSPSPAANTNTISARIAKLFSGKSSL
jgi:hypothetical protein